MSVLLETITTTGIAELVGNWGFPIAAFMLMYRMAEKTIKKNTESLNELEQAVKELE